MRTESAAGPGVVVCARKTQRGRNTFGIAQRAVGEYDDGILDHKSMSYT